MNKRIAVFPGTFDPITLGHIELVYRSLDLFDEIVIGVGNNTAKTTMYSLEQRMKWISNHFEKYSKVKVAEFDGLTVNFAKQQGAKFLIRGLRSAPDFEYEKNIHFLNQHLDNSVETIFLISNLEYNSVSSSLVREIIKFKGNLVGLVPQEIINDIYK